MKKYGRYSLLSWSWRILLGIALTPILLFLLLFVLIYTPPVQKYAVDRAAEWLSEEMGMDVTVEEVSLKFPLDLSMGGMLAVQDGDTVVAARELEVSVRALPLFHLKWDGGSWVTIKFIFQLHFPEAYVFFFNVAA